MLYRFSIVFLIGLCLVACSSGSMQEESVPVIRFKPDEARTLKMSELCKNGGSDCCDFHSDRGHD